MSAPDHPRSPHYWCAYLAASIAEAVKTRPFDHARSGLSKAVTDFKQTEACSPELRAQLNRIQKGEK